MNKSRIATLVALLVLAVVPCACVDEESDLGVNLVDHGTLYNGHTDTIFATAAYSSTDDSLLTSDYTFGIIGNYADPVFGFVSSTLYTQIALSSTDNSITTEDMVIDSAVLSLVNDVLFPDSTATYSFHFEVRHLAEPLADTFYYSTDAIEVDGMAPLYDGTLQVSAADTVVRLHLGVGISDVLVDGQSYTAEDFAKFAKGLRIKLLPGSDPGMMTINFAAVDTRLRVYYHRDTNHSYYDFTVGMGAKHFTHFDHNYAGTIFATGGDIDGAQRLYLEPLAGHQVHISFDSAVRAFAEQHPRAVIHHAELIMPVVQAGPVMPDMLVAVRQVDGMDTYINDLLSSGIDGRYHADGNYYRMRVSQHLQGLLRDGGDAGMRLVLDSRRSSAANVVLAGSQAANPIRIAFVYSE